MNSGLLALNTYIVKFNKLTLIKAVLKNIIEKVLLSTVILEWRK